MDSYRPQPPALVTSQSPADDWLSSSSRVFNGSSAAPLVGRHKPTFRRRRQWRRRPRSNRNPAIQQKRQRLRDDFRFQNPFGRRHGGGAAQPVKIKVPQVFPNTEGQKFSEIMKGAFNDMDLGQRLAALGRWSNHRLLQNPFGPNGNGSGTSSTSSGIGGSLHSSMLVTPMQVKTEPQEYGALGAIPRLEPEYYTGMVPAQAQENGFGSPPLSIPAETTELGRLLLMLDVNTQQSLKLKELVSKYLDSCSDGSLDSNSTNSSSKQCRCYLRSDRQPLVASMPGGGDSPDPPGDRQVPIRGHMIDQIGYTLGGTMAHEKSESDSDQPDSSFALKSSSATTMSLQTPKSSLFGSPVRINQPDDFFSRLPLYSSPREEYQTMMMRAPSPPPLPELTPAITGENGLEHVDWYICVQCRQPILKCRCPFVGKSNGPEYHGEDSSQVPPPSAGSSNTQARKRKYAEKSRLDPPTKRGRSNALGKAQEVAVRRKLNTMPPNLPGIETVSPIDEAIFSPDHPEGLSPSAFSYCETCGFDMPAHHH